MTGFEFAPYPTSPCIGFAGALPGNTGFGQHALAQTEVIVQHALDHRAQIGGRREVAALIEAGGLQPRPIRNHPAALHRTTRQ